MSLAPYWASPMCQLYQGDAASVLRGLPAESVDMAVTSPPFWGLRDYKVKDQIGLEPTPELWLERILAVFRGVRRVLRPWGVVFCEIGDSYASGKGTCFNPGGGEDSMEAHGKLKNTGAYPLDRGNKSLLVAQGLKPLDLVGIPFRLALALQQDGWWLRSVIIWNKPAPMPESVAGWRWEKCRVKIARTYRSPMEQKYRGSAEGWSPEPRPERNPPTLADWADCPGCSKCAPNGGLVLRKGSWRPTEAHSYILMLAKGTSYFCNGEAVRLPYSEFTTWEPYTVYHQKDASGTGAQFPGSLKARIREGGPCAGANLRSVWRIGPEPSSLPHFATYPTGLPEKCILAGTSEWGNCPRCGMPWSPVVKTTLIPQAQRQKDEKDWWHNWEVMGTNITQVLGWRASCSCGLSERVAPVVLDPFVGTGTSCVAAQGLGRKSIGIDLSEAYLRMAIKRLEGTPLPLGVA